MSKKKESKTFLLFVTLLGLSLGCAKSEPSTDDTSSDSNASESSDAESPEGDDTDDGGRGYRFGMGLDYVSPWTTQIVFVDAFKQTKPWDGYQNGTTEWITDIDDIPLPLSSRGYPAVDIPFDHDNDEQTGGFVVYTTVFSAVGDSYPAGNYTLRFSGEGTLWLGWDAGEYPELGYSATPRQYSSTGEAVSFSVPVVPNIGISIWIISSNSSNPIDNIELLLPGFEDSETSNPYHPFYPPFIEGLEGFEVIRPMNAVLTNEVLCDDPSHVPSDREAYKNCEISWSNRVTEDYYTYTYSRGMPWESVIDLVDAVDGADIWINIPHAANDEYVLELATLIRDRLSADRKVYVEWSNEVWNPGDGFPQHMWFEDNGLDVFPDDWITTAGAKFYVKGLLNIFAIFENVFSGQEDRLIRVLNSQQGYTQRTLDLLSHLEDEAVNPGLSGSIDALAVGAYFGWSLIEGSPGSYEEPSTETLLENARADVTAIPEQVRETRQAIDDYIGRTGRVTPISLLAYEGGAHITPMSTDWAYLGLGTNTDEIDWTPYAEANRHPDIYDIYIDWGEAWFENGGDLIVAFSYIAKIPGTYVNLADEVINIGTSAFSHLETPDQPLEDAPKLRAIKDMMQ